MPSVEIALVARPGRLAGKGLERRAAHVGIERHEAARAGCQPDVRVVDDQRVVLLRENDSAKPFDFALVATDTSASIEQIIERYAQRWAIEVCFRDAKQTTGVGEARNRTPLAVERTVPFGLLVQSLVMIWYAHAGHSTAVVAARRRLAPWYDQKTEPSWLDMLATLRRQLIADRFRALPHPAVDHAEIHDPAWILELIAS